MKEYIAMLVVQSIIIVGAFAVGLDCGLFALGGTLVGLSVGYGMAKDRK